MPKMVTVSPSVYTAMHQLQQVRASEDQQADVNTWWSRVYAADVAKANYLDHTGAPDDGKYVPPTASSTRHTGWQSAAGTVVAEMQRQANLADTLKVQHWARAAEYQEEALRLETQARDLRQQANDLRMEASAARTAALAAASDDDEAAGAADDAADAAAAEMERRAAELDAQAVEAEAGAEAKTEAADLENEAASLAIAWYEAARMAWRYGDDTIKVYDRLFAGLNAAAQRAMQGGVLDAADDPEYHGA